MTGNKDESLDRALRTANLVSYGLIIGLLMAAAGLGFLLQMSSNQEPTISSGMLNFIRLAVIAFAAVDFFVANLMFGNLTSDEQLQKASEGKTDAGNAPDQMLTGTIVALSLGEGPAFLGVFIGMLSRSFVDIVIGLLIFIPFLLKYFPRKDQWKKKLRKIQYTT